MGIRSVRIGSGIGVWREMTGQKIKVDTKVLLPSNFQDAASCDVGDLVKVASVAAAEGVIHASGR